MDAEAALRDLRALSALALSGNAGKDTLESLAETFTGLDEWLCRGGFLPTEWAQARRNCYLSTRGN